MITRQLSIAMMANVGFYLLRMKPFAHEAHLIKYSNHVLQKNGVVRK